MAANGTVLSVEKFNRILSAVRQLEGHRFVKNITKEDPEYLTLKQVAVLAEQFAERYDIQPREEGYRSFCVIGIRLMGKKYALSKFKYHLEKIGLKFEAQLAIANDRYPSGTKEIFACYRNTMAAEAGVDISSVSKDDRWLHVIYAREEADDAKAVYADWVQAQFDELSFLDTVPELTQLYGENARIRYERYMQKNGKKKKVAREKSEEGLSDAMSDELREYFRALREKRATD